MWLVLLQSHVVCFQHVFLGWFTVCIVILFNFPLFEGWVYTLSGILILGSWFDRQRLWTLLMYVSYCTVILQLCSHLHSKSLSCSSYAHVLILWDWFSRAMLFIWWWYICKITDSGRFSHEKKGREGPAVLRLSAGIVYRCQCHLSVEPVSYVARAGGQALLVPDGDTRWPCLPFFIWIFLYHAQHLMWSNLIVAVVKEDVKVLLLLLSLFVVLMMLSWCLLFSLYSFYFH